MQDHAPSPRILTFASDPAFQHRLEEALRRLGCAVLSAPGPGEAPALAAARSPDAVLAGAAPPRGLETLETAAAIKRDQGLPVIIAASLEDDALFAAVERLAPDGAIPSGPSDRRLALALSLALNRSRRAPPEVFEARLEALRQSEAKYRLLAENAEDVIWTLDNELRFTYISPSVKSLRGLTPEEAMAQSVEESMPAESFAVVRQAILTWMEQRRLGNLSHVARFEIEQYRKDGSTVWLECTVRPAFDASGEQAGFVGVSRNMSERRDAERALRESEERFRSLWDALPLPAEILDATGRILAVNRPFLEQFGGAGIPGKMIWEFCIDPEEAEMARLFFKNAAASQPDLTRAFVKMRDVNGQETAVQINWSYRLDTEGRLAGFVGVRTDVTQVLRAEAALRESEERFAALFKFSPEIAALSSLDNGVYLEVNDAFCASTGYSREELIGRSSLEIKLWADPADRDRALAVLAQGRPVIAMETRIRSKDGSVWPSLFSAAAVTISGERRLLTLALDISERKRLEEETLRARDEAVAASKAKTAFLTRISHEIRTPMNSILGLAEMLAQASGLTDRQRGYAADLMRAGEHLLGIINNVLDFSAIEAGRLTLENKPFSPATVLSEAVSLLSSPAREKGLSMRQEIARDVPELAMGDAGRLRQIIMNLGANAIKYSERGRIVLRLETKRDANGGGQLAFEVEDQGIGVPQEAFGHLFKEFSRAPGTSGRFQGSGLGLAIAKRLTEGMGGRIGFESVSGQGSRFFFTLPLTPCEGPSPAAEAPPGIAAGKPLAQDGKRFTILLVEDNPANVIIVTLFLEDLPVSIASAENGARAVALCRDNVYDVILMDIDMPLMDGREASMLIRSIEREAERPPQPIIALTAHAFSEYRDMMAKAGCNDYLAKPIRKKDLVKAIERQLGQPLEPRTAQREGAGPAGPDGADDERISSSLRPIIPAFLEIQRKNLGRMNQALAEKNGRDLRRLGHNLKGAALTYGFSRMADFGADLERAALDGDMALAANILRDLTNHFNNVHIVYGDAPNAGDGSQGSQGRGGVE